MAYTANQRKAMRINQVLDTVGLSKSQLYRLIKSGKFPRGTNLSERIVVWDMESVDKWLEAKFMGAQM